MTASALSLHRPLVLVSRSCTLPFIIIILYSGRFTVLGHRLIPIMYSYYFLFNSGACVSVLLLQVQFPYSWFVGKCFFSVLLNCLIFILVVSHWLRLGRFLLGHVHCWSNFNYFFKHASICCVMAAVIVIYVSIMANALPTVHPYFSCIAFDNLSRLSPGRFG